jgi:hypothetical protein
VEVVREARPTIQRLKKILAAANGQNGMLIAATV